ncbi:MAG: cyclic pyranopterin monophosphate synthase MoaC [Candidatus Magnetoovum sp. WYHC-5]|nr:cyclic pyranopterin monophosphate synthase MoaC [Candidatus Magnetoovum sp. WYHC-5]
MEKLTHIDTKGEAHMVDVTAKDDTSREAHAKGSVYMKKSTLQLLKDNQLTKGDALQVAKIAGIMGAKQTSSLVPLCHPLNITSISVELNIDDNLSCVNIDAVVKITGKTGVEMEALTAVSITALTIYDMCKAVDKEIVISDICLVEKKGGKSGHFKRKEK